MEERVHQKNDAPFFESKLNFSILRQSKHYILRKR